MKKKSKQAKKNKSSKIKIKSSKVNVKSLIITAAAFAFFGVATLVISSAQTVNYTPNPGCQYGNTTPVGQANPSVEPEPMGAIWCFPLSNSTGATRINNTNSWIDEFSTNVQMQKFNDLDYGYRVFDNAGSSPASQSRHFINNNHWMLDTTGAFTGGSSLSPNRSFKFENGKFILEGDAAVGVPEYGNDQWLELTISNASAPNAIADNLYAYGQFGNNWSVGCRLQGATLVPVCAVMAPAGYPISGGCFSTGQRLMELSFFQVCGENSGGTSGVTDSRFPGKTGSDFWRKCEPNQMDMFCRDRFRLEVTKSSLTLFVNGFKYFESKNWPANKQLPDSFINGDIYAYQSNWSYRSDNKGKIYRYHWDHYAVNPPGGFTGSPSFCLNQPNSTCEVVLPSPINTSPPAPSNGSGQSSNPSTTTTNNPSTAQTVQQITNQTETNKVDIIDYGYSPKDIVVKKGTRVTWSNTSALGISHSITSQNGIFDSGIYSPGQSFSYTFTEPGVYPYYCIPHPTMLGTVTVKNDDGTVPAVTQIPTATSNPSIVQAGKPEISTVNPKLASGTGEKTDLRSELYPGVTGKVRKIAYDSVNRKWPLAIAFLCLAGLIITLYKLKIFINLKNRFQT